MIRRIRLVSAVLLAWSVAAGPAIAQSAAPGSPASPGAAPAASAPVSPSPPPLVLEGSPPDAGLGAPLTVRDGSFVVRNTSSQAVRIVAAASNCECLTVVANQRTVDPGASVAIHYALELPERLGKTLKEARVFAAGFQAPLVVGITAESAYPVRVNPGGVPETLEKKGTVILESAEKLPFRVLKVNGEAPSFVGFDPEKDTPRDRYEIAYDWSDRTTRFVPRYLAVQTDHPGATLLDIRTGVRGVWGMWRGGRQWHVQEDRIMLGDFAAGQQQEVAVTLNLIHDPKYTMTVSADDEAVKVELVSFGPSKTKQKASDVLVRVTTPPDREGYTHFVLTYRIEGVFSNVDVFGLARK